MNNDLLHNKKRVQELVNELFNGKLPGDLDEVIQGWLVSEENNETKDAVVRELFWQEIKKVKKPNRNTLRSLRKMEQRLGWETKRTVPLRRHLFRIAAVLVPVALVVGGYFWIESRYADQADDAHIAFQEVAVAPGEKKHLVLADGTEVTLNQGSEFSYGDNRECSLRGEAYFNVAKADKPFVIHTGHINVKVLGTEFNLNAYPDSNTSVIALYSGSVEVDCGLGTYKMTPGMEFRYDNETQAVNITQFDPSASEAKPSWIAESEWSAIYSLDEIFRMIESRYGLTIENKDIPDTTQHFTFKLDNSPVDTVMAAVRAISGDFDYRIEGNRIVIEPVKK